MQRLFAILLLTVSIVISLNAATANIDKIWLEQDVVEDGVKGIRVHAKFRIDGMKGRKCKAIAYFESPKGTGLKDRNGKYSTKSGAVCALKTFTPTYDASNYSDFKIFIPKSELHLPAGSHTYYCRVQVRPEGQAMLASSSYVSFTASGGSTPKTTGKSTASSGSSTPKKKTASASSSSGSSKKKGFVREWREECPPGFVIVREAANGNRSRTTFFPCPACRGTLRCQHCQGTHICELCHGRGGTVTAGYGTYIPCTACNQTGRCAFCRETKKCGACRASDYPGYIARSTLIVDRNGRVLANSRDYDTLDDDDRDHRRKSNYSSRTTCPKCHGAKFEPTYYKYASASASGWMNPYHHYAGSACEYCGYGDDHYHNPCSECHGFGTVKN